MLNSLWYFYRVVSRFKPALEFARTSGTAASGRGMSAAPGYSTVRCVIRRMRQMCGGSLLCAGGVDYGQGVDLPAQWKPFENSPELASLPMKRNPSGHIRLTSHPSGGKPHRFP